MNSTCATTRKSGALNITQKVDNGITLLLALAKKDASESTSIRAIAEEQNLSFSFLQKIAGELQRSGLIKAERGKNGGYRIAKQPETLFLKEIIEALEGPIAIVPCLKPFGQISCDKSAMCQVKNGFAKINDEIQDHLLSKSLAYFLS